MQQTLPIAESRTIGRHIISKIKEAVRNEMRFETVSSEILNSISNQLLMVTDTQQRKKVIQTYYEQLQKADLIRQYHMVYEQPARSKQLHAGLNHLKDQFKARFGRYL